MKTGIFTLLLAGWMVLPAVAQTVEETTTTATAKLNPREEAIDANRMLRDFEILPPPSESRAVEAMLRKRVDMIDWTDKPFEEVLDWLREQGEGRVNIVAKWGPLGVENVNRESFVSLRLNNTTVADVLNETIEQLSETGDVQYRGVGNKLTITTRQDFERKLYVRVYDVTDVLFRVPDFGQDAPRIDLAQQNQGGQGGGAGGQSVFSGSGSTGQESESDEQAQQRLTERLNEMRQLIEQTIAPETWDVQTGPGGQAAGGGKGRIRVFNRSLVVLNTIEVHEQIAGEFALGG